MKRRGFLGIIGGAAVAGPSAAKAVVAKMPVGIVDASATLLPSVGYSGSGHGQSVGLDRSWKLSEIANIKRFLGGELSDEEKEQRKRQKMYNRQSIINQRIAGLVSVSGVYKFDMYNREIAEMNEDIAKSEARGRLHWLLRDE